MIDTFPAVCDALATKFALALGNPSLVFDGPQARNAGPAGIAIGTTLEDVSSAFTDDPSDLSGNFRQETTIACLAWAGGGGTVFKPYRDRVRDLVQVASEALAVDTTIGGTVSTSQLIGGTWMQAQSGEGALVTCELRILVRKF